MRFGKLKVLGSSLALGILATGMAVGLPLSLKGNAGQGQLETHNHPHKVANGSNGERSAVREAQLVTVGGVQFVPKPELQRTTLQTLADIIRYHDWGMKQATMWEALSRGYDIKVPADKQLVFDSVLFCHEGCGENSDKEVKGTDVKVYFTLYDKAEYEKATAWVAGTGKLPSAEEFEVTLHGFGSTLVRVVPKLSFDSEKILPSYINSPEILHQLFDVEIPANFELKRVWPRWLNDTKRVWMLVLELENKFDPEEQIVRHFRIWSHFLNDTERFRPKDNVERIDPSTINSLEQLQANFDFQLDPEIYTVTAASDFRITGFSYLLKDLDSAYLREFRELADDTLDDDVLALAGALTFKYTVSWQENGKVVTETLNARLNFLDPRNKFYNFGLD